METRTMTSDIFSLIPADGPHVVRTESSEDQCVPTEATEPESYVISARWFALLKEVMTKLYSDSKLSPDDHRDLAHKMGLCLEHSFEVSWPVYKWLEAKEAVENKWLEAKEAVENENKA
jgi:hypothetical protein